MNKEINTYEVYLLGAYSEDNGLKTTIKAINTTQMYKEFISLYKDKLIKANEINPYCVICWVKKGTLMTTNGQKDLNILLNSSEKEVY